MSIRTPLGSDTLVLAPERVAHLLALFDDAVALVRFDGHVIVREFKFEVQLYE